MRQICWRATTFTESVGCDEHSWVEESDLRWLRANCVGLLGICGVDTMAVNNRTMALDHYEGARAAVKLAQDTNDMREAMYYIARGELQVKLAQLCLEFSRFNVAVPLPDPDIVDDTPR